MAVTARQKTARDYFIAQGYCPAGACAIVGNLVQESGTNLASAYAPIGERDHGSVGIAQWRLDRKTALEMFGGATVQTLETQCAFLVHELKTGYPELEIQLHDLKRSVENLTANFCFVFERPNRKLAGLDTRINAAKLLLADYNLHPAHEATVVAVGGISWAALIACLGASPDFRNVLLVVTVMIAFSICKAVYKEVKKVFKWPHFKIVFSISED